VLKKNRRDGPFKTETKTTSVKTKTAKFRSQDRDCAQRQHRCLLLLLFGPPA